MMQNNPIKLEMKSHSVNEALARQFAAVYVSYFDPDIQQLAEIKTAVSEAVSNSIIHGYEGRSDGLIILEFCVEADGRLYINITDYGRGIEDIEKAKEPLYTTGNPEERAGMGFTVMESFMDELIVKSQLGLGTKVTLIKKLGAEIG